MKLFRQLYFQVLIAFILGSLYGHFCPQTGSKLQWIAQAFVKLVTMLIGPIIFCTIVSGIAGVSDLKKVGKVGLKAIVYFELITTAALILGLVIVNVVKPGAGIHATAAKLDPTAIQGFVTQANELHSGGVAGFLLGLIPATFVSAFTSGQILQVLLVSILFGVALLQLGEKGKAVTHLIDVVFKAMMQVVNIVVLLAPLATFAAMAFVVGKFGFHSLRSLASLMVCVYGTMVLFIAIVLGTVVRLNGLRLTRLLRFLRDEIWLVIGTSSSETALPGLMAKMERLGCSKSLVGLVVPAGYAFNLDGTCIYLTMAAIFVGQATDTPLTLVQQIGMLVALLLLSKGSAAVTGGGFITLAGTLEVIQTVPVAGLSLIIGVDRFMSQARSLTNLIGNAVAVVTVANWEGELDRDHARKILEEG